MYWASVLVLLATAAVGDDAAYWMAQGVGFAKDGEMIRAEDAFHRACLMDPKLPDACLYLGRTLYLLDRFSDAINVLKTAGGSDPRNAQIWRIEALALEGAGKAEEADAAFRRAIELERNSARNEDPSIDYGVFLYRSGRAEAALAPLEAAVKRHPDGARAQLEFGCALLSLDRLSEATAALEKATALDPSNARGHLLLGRAYERLGKAELAKRELARGSLMLK